MFAVQWGGDGGADLATVIAMTEKGMPGRLYQLEYMLLCVFRQCQRPSKSEVPAL
jgi:hypothetical protein